MLAIRPITPKLLKTYIYLPNKLYANDPLFVPPIYADEFKFHNPKHNEALQYCITQKWLIFKDDVPVGRIMGIIHPPYNKQHGLKEARFYQLDCINDLEVMKALLNEVITWAKSQGMTSIIGPYGFSDKDPQGYKTAGFEVRSVLLTPANPEYLPQFLLQYGFHPHVKALSYHLPIPEQLPGIYKAVCERAQKQGYFKTLKLTSKKQLKPFIIPVLHLVNKTYSHLFGFVAMTDEEIHKLAKQYLPILDPTLVKVVVDPKQEVVGFVVSMPDISEALQKAKGKLFPFGLFYLLKALKTSKKLVLLLGAVEPGLRGRGVTALLADALLTTAKEKGMTEIDSHVILDSNQLMKAEVVNLGGFINKEFTVFKLEWNA